MLETFVHRAGLGDIYRKIVDGQRLSFDDGLTLYRNPHLSVIGWLANLVRERLHGDQTFFVRNQHINYTNVCNKGCLFCSFYALPKDPNGYVLTPEQIQDKVRAYAHLPITEIHMVGGVNVRLPYAYYLDIVRAIKTARPDVSLKAFTMIEIEQIRRVSRKPLEEVFGDLMTAGVDALPGGGAEVFSDRVHEELFHAKSDSDKWLDTARAAHRVGLPSNATLLYGHVEQTEEKVYHLVKLRELQDETGGFLAFIPLSWHPERTAISHLPGPTGQADLREIAVARLMLDNVPHIKSFWIMNSPAVTQVALRYGADDMDGSVMEYEITRDPSTDRIQTLTHARMLDMIAEAGRQPVERDALYRIVASPQPRMPAYLEPEAGAAGG
ncbi:MAG: CofH family radical SAM protein [candidate division Zixibacteria bacterium]|nr:CofH family radical SAM protein [candidate division Zixibacteria bacterium]